MGLFGKKEPTVFDQDQNKQLQTLAKNQTVLIKNNAYFIKSGQNHWAWIQKLKADNDALLQRIGILESTIIAMKQTDKKFAEMFSGLASLSASKAETVTE